MEPINFDEVKDDFEVLPEGYYNVTCCAAEIKTTKKGNGEYISCQFKVTDGNYANRIIFHNFNIKNINPNAVKMGIQQLRRFCLAAGSTIKKFSDVNVLCGLSCNATVKIRQSEGYGDQNTISNFNNISNKNSTIMSEDVIPF